VTHCDGRRRSATIIIRSRRRLSASSMSCQRTISTSLAHPRLDAHLLFHTGARASAAGPADRWDEVRWPAESIGLALLATSSPLYERAATGAGVIVRQTRTCRGLIPDASVARWRGRVIAAHLGCSGRTKDTDRCTCNYAPGLFVSIHFTSSPDAYRQNPPAFSVRLKLPFYQPPWWSR